MHVSFHTILTKILNILSHGFLLKSETTSIFQICLSEFCKCRLSVILASVEHKLCIICLHLEHVKNQRRGMGHSLYDALFWWLIILIWYSSSWRLHVPKQRTHVYYNSLRSKPSLAENVVCSFKQKQIVRRHLFFSVPLICIIYFQLYIFNFLDILQYSNIRFVHSKKIII